MWELARDFWCLISTPDGLKTLIGWGGIPVMTLIVFMETGLLVGFFLPGDSLLFVAGFLASPAGGMAVSIFWLNVFLMAAAIVEIGGHLTYFARPVAWNEWLVAWKEGPPSFNNRSPAGDEGCVPGAGNGAGAPRAKRLGLARPAMASKGRRETTQATRSRKGRSRPHRHGGRCCDRLSMPAVVFGFSTGPVA